MRSANTGVLMRAGLALVPVLLVASLWSPAQADLDPRVPPRIAERSLGGEPVLLPNGLYRVALSDGYEMTTHGPDPVLAGHGTDLGPGDPERAPECATGNVMHVLYGHPALISSSRLDQVKDNIRAHIRRTNAVLNDAALESGDVTADYKVLCDETGEIRVDTFSNGTIFPYFTNIVEGARQAGFTDPDVDYVIFYDGDFPGVCGFGELYDDTRASADNRNNQGGYGVTYKSCWFSRTPMHENGHTQGAVQTGAPNEDGTGHCTEQQDIMCYPSPSRECPTIMQFDCGYDTYFDAAPEAGEWLDSRWNIGSRDNRYIAFGDAPSSGPPESAGRPIRDGSGGSESGEAAPEDPAAMIATSTDSPIRGRRFAVKLWLTSCGGHEGTVIELQRRKDGAFVTVSRRTLDDDCIVSVRLRAGFNRAVFRSFWSQQDDDHDESFSRPLRIQTRS